MKDNSTRKAAKNKAISLLINYKKELVLGFVSLLLVDIADVLPPYIIKLAIDAVETKKALNYLLTLGLALILLALVQGVCRFFIRKFFMGTSHCANYDLRKELFEHLLKLPFNFFNKTRTGELMSRMTNDLNEIRFMLGIGVLVVLDISFYFLTIPFFMLWISVKLTLVSWTPLVLMPILVFIIKRKIHYRSTKVQERLAELSASAEEAISGIKITKGFETETNVVNKINTVGKNFLDDKMQLAKLESVLHPTLSLIMAISTVVLLIFGGKMVITGAITLGSFVALKAYLSKLSWPMLAIGFVVNLYQKGIASLERANQILDETPKTVVEKSDNDINITDFGLIFENVSYKYPESKSDVVKNVSFKIASGKTLGITGPIGCGKTTLLRLLMKIIEPESGTIKIGNQLLTKMPTEKLKKTFSYVPQDGFLFSETIEENILFARNDDSGDALIYSKMAGLESDISSFKDGLGTILGERGVNLSGGQKQRVALARALAAKANILILDDCTSAVDTETEQKILQNLNDDSNTLTCVIVSHRLASLQRADKIIYMENGKIIESGNHQSLLEINGNYASLWEKQKIEENMEVTN